jgi:hypothetical protein
LKNAKNKEILQIDNIKSKKNIISIIKIDIFKYFIIFYNIMTIQINLRITKDFFEKAKDYAKSKGFLNVQEFFRETAREKIYENYEVKTQYLKRLNSKEANTFLSEKETEEFEKELKKRVK